MSLFESLDAFKRGELSRESLLEEIAKAPFESHAIGRIDHLRQFRTGIPEVILGDGKEPQDVVQLFESYLDRETPLFLTRASASITEALNDLNGRIDNRLTHFKKARIWSTHSLQSARNLDLQGTVAVVSAGSLDRQVFEEAAVSAALFGLEVDKIADVGVAGLNRLLPELDRINEAVVVIVVAGMDGALPSVLAGLVDSPLIAVPTSVGYGAAFNGVAPLLSMLNACSPGVAVMNIDNGFGAAAHALKIVRRVNRRQL